MRKKILLLSGALATLVFSGCAVQPPQPQQSANQYAPRPAAAPVDIGADWAYQVEGDAAIRPVQVFSMGGKTYLQMRPQQVVPAIVVGGAPVPFRISQPYLVIDGTPSVINLISDGYRAVITQTQGTAPEKRESNGLDRIKRVAIQ